QLLQWAAGVEGQHIDARRHQLTRHAIAELDDGVDHLPFAGLEDALLLADVDEGLHFLFRHLLRLLVALVLALQALGAAAQRKKHGPEDVVKEARDGNEKTKNR